VFFMGSVLRFTVALAVPLFVGLISGMATSRGVRDWYPTLVKPPFNPPSWVFAPVWTLLYLMMGGAAFLVWQRGLESPGVRLALGLFLFQLLLNGLWSILFFGMRAPGLAMVDVVLLWMAIAGAMVSFWQVSPVAGLLLAPYQAWVTFAAVLNGAIWVLNR